MVKHLKPIIKALPRYRKAAAQIKESLLANLVLLGEIPAPTFEEQNRINLLGERFKGSHLSAIGTDAIGNCQATLAGASESENILIVAHADCVIPLDADHTISIESDRIVGPGVGDNSLGLAVLPTIPELLNTLDINLNANLVLLAVTRSLGRANLEGIRFFLDQNEMQIGATICLEGVQLGRLSIASIGMLRGEINCRVPDEYDWSRFGTGGAIFEINEVISRLVEIPLPSRPRSSIVLGSVHAGTSFNRVATSAILRFEIRSESAELVDRICGEVEDIVIQTNSATEAEVTLNVLARRTPGGLVAGHPLPRAARQIMTELDVNPRLAPSTSELSALIDRNIPGLTIGLTTGEHIAEEGEAVQIEPIFTGLSQLVGILVALDSGLCNEN